MLYPQMPECVESRVSATPETIIFKLCILYPSMPIAIAIRYRIPLAVFYLKMVYIPSIFMFFSSVRLCFVNFPFVFYVF